MELEIQTNSELDEYRVAVVVFTSVRAVDRLDARHIAEAAVSLVIRDAQRVHPGSSGEPCGELFMRRVSQSQNLCIPVQVAAIRELGVACGNGYLWVEPTAKAYRERDWSWVLI